LQQNDEDRRVDALIAWMRKKNLTRCTPREVCRANVAGVKKASDAAKLLQAAIDCGYGDDETPPSSRSRRRGPEVQCFHLRGNA
jgi:hypothetical protein